jgi:photosystem II stability/assembly factor-like uncharacterized protein
MKWFYLGFYLLFFGETFYSQWDTIVYTGTTNYRDLEYVGEGDFIISSPYAITKYNIYNNQIDTLIYDQTKFFGELSFINKDTGYVVNLYNGILKTENAGASWFEVNSTLLTAYNYRDILFINNNLGFFTGANSGAGTFKTTDGGVTWDTLYDYTLQHNPMLGGRSLALINDSVISQVGGGRFYSSFDYGTNWNEIIIANPTSGTYSKVKSKNSLTVLAGQRQQGQNRGVIAVSNNQGFTWDIIVDNIEINIYRDIEIIDDTTIFAVGAAQGQYHYSIYKSIDGGLNWLPQDYSYPLPTYPYLNNIACINKDTCVACGYNGLIIKTTNGGGPLVGLSIEDPINNDNVAVYPNPSDNIINISSTAPLQRLQLFDTRGALIQARSNMNTQDATLDISYLSSGIYLLQITTQEGVYTQKIQKR